MVDMGVCRNGGTAKWMVSKGNSYRAAEDGALAFPMTTHARENHSLRAANNGFTLLVSSSLEMNRLNHRQISSSIQFVSGFLCVSWKGSQINGRERWKNMQTP